MQNNIVCCLRHAMEIWIRNIQWGKYVLQLLYEIPMHRMEQKNCLHSLTDLHVLCGRLFSFGLFYKSPQKRPDIVMQTFEWFSLRWIKRKIVDHFGSLANGTNYAERWQTSNWQNKKKNEHSKANECDSAVVKWPVNTFVLAARKIIL